VFTFLFPFHFSPLSVARLACAFDMLMLKTNALLNWSYRRARACMSPVFFFFFFFFFSSLRWWGGVCLGFVCFFRLFFFFFFFLSLRAVSSRRDGFKKIVSVIFVADESILFALTDGSCLEWTYLMGVLL